MTDRELLEIAAKAYGLQVKGWVGNKFNYYDPILDYAGFGDWNPLEDDGDALRLAVKLFLTIGINDGFTEILSERKGCTEPHSTTNSYTATRRAIVRAAAEIGKDMK